MDFADPKRHARALSEALQTVSIAQFSDDYQHETTPIVPLRPIPPRLTSSDRPVGRARALSQLRLAGAPPAAVPTSPRSSLVATFSAPADIPAFHAVTIPPTPRVQDGFDAAVELSWTTEPAPLDAAGELKRETAEGIMDEADVRILPDESWIVVVCGVSKDWGKEDGEELPHNFFVAPRDVYMPDLTAAADVLLGKLGYGTVSECVDSCTPFVYGVCLPRLLSLVELIYVLFVVPRPLFIEEHGLRLYLEREGVGVELSRTQYEVGEWADAIEAAWQRGREAKARKRQEGETGRRNEEGREMAQYVVDWVGRWKDAMDQCDGSKRGGGGMGLSATHLRPT